MGGVRGPIEALPWATYEEQNIQGSVWLSRDAVFRWSEVRDGIVYGQDYEVTVEEHSRIDAIQAREIEVFRSSVGTAEAVQKLTLINSDAGRLVCKEGEISGSTVREKINCENLAARNCLKLGYIEASGDVALRHCSLREREVAPIAAGSICTAKSLDLFKSHIGFANVYGPVKLHDSTVDGSLWFVADEALFERSRVKLVSMRPIAGHHQSPILRLNDCEVEEVRFEHEPGTVILSHHSPEPVVQNGEIVRRDY